MTSEGLRLRTLNDVIVNGVTLQPGDHAGYKRSRPSANPDGEKIDYMLETVVPVQQGDAVVLAPTTLDVTEQVLSGEVVVVDRFSD